MEYFVRFNQNANKVFAIDSFTESIRAKDRTMTVQLKVASPENSDVITSKASEFLISDSVSKIEILNEHEIVVFSTSLYKEAESLDVSINLGADLEDETHLNDAEILYNLFFHFEEN